MLGAVCDGVVLGCRGAAQLRRVVVAMAAAMVVL